MGSGFWIMWMLQIIVIVELGLIYVRLGQK